MSDAHVVNIKDFQWFKAEKRYILPDDVVRVDRGTPWGNPFRVGKDGDRAEVIAKYRDWLAEKITADHSFVGPLYGKRLACWCAPLPCHADVLVEWMDE